MKTMSGSPCQHYDELMENIVKAQDLMLQHGIEANSVTLNGRKYGMLIENLPPNIKPTIFGMSVKAEYAMPDDYDFLIQYEPPHPQTNADRIRSMTDEELAEWIAKHMYCAECMFFNDENGICNYKHRYGKGCNGAMLEWLKEEAK